MALIHSPPPGDPTDAASVSSHLEENKCTICEELIVYESEECYKVSTCGHIFHKCCIEQFLSASSDCPTCKAPCQLPDLRDYSTRRLLLPDNASQTGTRKKTRPSFRCKGRGVLGNRPNTRSLGKTLLHFDGNVTNGLDMSPRQSHNLAEAADPYSPAHTSNTRIQQIFSDISPNQVASVPPHAASSTVDYERINRMIENSLSRMLQSLNIGANTAPNPTLAQAGGQGQARRRSAQAPPLHPNMSNINNNRDNFNPNLT